MAQRPAAWYLQELVRNAESWASSQTFKCCISTRSSGDSYAHPILRNIDLYCSGLEVTCCYFRVLGNGIFHLWILVFQSEKWSWQYKYYRVIIRTARQNRRKAASTIPNKCLCWLSDSCSSWRYSWARWAHLTLSVVKCKPLAVVNTTRPALLSPAPAQQENCVFVNSRAKLNLEVTQARGPGSRPQPMFFADCSLKATEFTNGELLPWNSRSPTPARIIGRFSRGSLLYNRTETFTGEEAATKGGRQEIWHVRKAGVYKYCS